MKELGANPELIQNYDLLQRTGVIDHINELNMTINNLESLFDEAWEITSKRSIDEIINYVISTLLDRFAPSFFTVILQERRHPKRPAITCYKDMRPVNPDIKIKSLKPFRDFFSLYPNPISFSLLEYKLNDKQATDSLLPFSPEILVPIIGFWGLYGLIIIGKKLVDGEYKMEEVAYLDRLMKFTSIGIQNNIHHQSSITDLKTGLYNHAFFRERLEEELARIERHQTRLALLMIDIDFFKVFNDTHGHLVGDEVLTAVAEILAGLTRREDVAARFGGEEFVVLLTRISKETSWRIAERIRETIAAMDFTNSGEKLKVTVSIGVRYVDNSSLSTAQQLINDADQALYRSKREGRNRTTVFNPGLLFQAARLNQTAEAADTQSIHQEQDGNERENRLHKTPN